MIIGLTGKAQAGKDTIGQYLVEQHKFERLAFADKLKEALSALFDFDRSHSESFKENGSVIVSYTHEGTFIRRILRGRTTYQRGGTEMGREVFGANFWVDQVLVDPETYYHAEQKYEGRNIVITDVRFETEARRVRKLGGYVVEVDRPSLTSDDLHISETEYSMFPKDYLLINDGTIPDLHAKTNEMLEALNARELSNN
jgi:hypothetical protein